MDLVYPSQQLRFRESGRQCSLDGARLRVIRGPRTICGDDPGYAQARSIQATDWRYAIAQFVPNAIFAGHAVDHRRAAARRGNGGVAVRATYISAVPRKASGHTGARFHAGKFWARLLPGPLLREADHPRHKLQDQQIHRPRDAVPGAFRLKPNPQFFPYDGKTLGRGGGACFPCLSGT